MKYGLQLRRVEVTPEGTRVVSWKTVDRLNSVTHGAPHTTRASAQAHADAYNRNPKGTWKARVVKL